LHDKTIQSTADFLIVDVCGFFFEIPGREVQGERGLASVHRWPGLSEGRGGFSGAAAPLVSPQKWGKPSRWTEVDLGIHVFLQQGK
jgi:hypothetical protein